MESDNRSLESVLVIKILYSVASLNLANALVRNCVVALIDKMSTFICDSRWRIYLKHR